MDLSFTKGIFLELENYIVRDLLIEDVGENYLSWFEDQTTQKFIMGSQDISALNDLRNYVKEKYNDPSTALLGVFDSCGKHVANIKYDHFGLLEDSTVMGILVGDPSQRGKGLAGKLIKKTSEYFFSFGIKRVYLGVENDNDAAIKAYQKIGFEFTEESPLRKKKNCGVMVLSSSREKN